MKKHLAYWWAIIDAETGECIGIDTTSYPITQDDAPEYIQIEGYNPDYEGKYYINGAWYEDEAGEIPWQPEE